MKLLIILSLSMPLLGFAQDTTSVQTASSCPVSDSLKSLKKVPKGLPERALIEAEASEVCVVRLREILGDKNSQWKKFRKVLIEKQPAAIAHLYGIRKLSSDEQKRAFFSSHLLDTALCTAFADSVGLDNLSGKDWIKKTTLWDTTAFPCKTTLATRIVPLLDSILTDTTLRRTKLLAYFPETWYQRFAPSATSEEQARYATSPSLTDSSHCGFIDGATAEQLMRLGTPDNACKAYIIERWGAPILRMSFRKTYKPAVLNAINKRFASATPTNLDSLQGLVDTLEVLFGDGESWDVTDSLEASLLRMIAKNPQAIRMMKEPTVPMLLTAFDNQLTLLCNYSGSINDRMIFKLIGDRASEEKPMPTAEELAALEACLPTDLISNLRKAIQPYLNP